MRILGPRPTDPDPDMAYENRPRRLETAPKMIYWAIATSTKYPDIFVEKIEAVDDKDAAEKAKIWHQEKLGFRYDYVVAKEISKLV